LSHVLRAPAVEGTHLPEFQGISSTRITTSEV
jgi:hypothetical protein